MNQLHAKAGPGVRLLIFLDTPAATTRGRARTKTGPTSQSEGVPQHRAAPGRGGIQGSVVFDSTSGTGLGEGSRSQGRCSAPEQRAQHRWRGEGDVVALGRRHGARHRTGRRTPARRRSAQIGAVRAERDRRPREGQGSFARPHPSSGGGGRRHRRLAKPRRRLLALGQATSIVQSARDAA